MCSWTSPSNLGEYPTVEISPKPVAPLLQYLSRTENRFVHFATSQRDGEASRNASRRYARTD
jgi:hypothetical protein